ncbi:hypothetical protein BC629DRAFT_1589215 [Irpex lacteus]|nr:hypothetical protein BC629DRAFT_1589215 [Irpex lacteus]
MSARSENHWRMQLNNYLQGNGGTKMLSWEVYPSGPSHEVVWTATVFIRGAPYARCVSSRQNTAMEEAARQTLQTLRQLEGQRSY